MEEADVLGDRIAILTNGVLMCCGSSLYLKHLAHTAYLLSVQLKVLSFIVINWLSSIN